MLVRGLEAVKVVRDARVPGHVLVGRDPLGAVVVHDEDREGKEQSERDEPVFSRATELSVAVKGFAREVEESQDQAPCSVGCAISPVYRSPLACGPSARVAGGRWSSPYAAGRWGPPFIRDPRDSRSTLGRPTHSGGGWCRE